MNISDSINPSSPIHHYLDAFKQYSNFTGTATRTQFRYFALFNVIASLVLAGVGYAILGQQQSSTLSSIYSLVALVPGLAVGARRLHDIGKSGWMQLIVLIPLVGAIWLIVLFATETKTLGNEYKTPLEVI